MGKKTDEKKTLKDVLGMVDIMPKKDFRITFNKWDIKIEEGVSVAIPPMFLQNMVTEGVIDKLPKEG